MKPRLRKVADEPAPLMPVLDAKTRRALERQRRQLLQLAAELQQLLDGTQTPPTAATTPPSVVNLFRKLDDEAS